jgi:hypothetical protein
VCTRELNNSSDRYAVAVKKGGTIVGHLPRKITRLCCLFLRHGGTINCEVSGKRRYSSDLVQGGLEVPCKLFFSGDTGLMNKLKKLRKSLM